MSNLKRNFIIRWAVHTDIKSYIYDRQLLQLRLRNWENWLNVMLFSNKSRSIALQKKQSLGFSTKLFLNCEQLLGRKLRLTRTGLVEMVVIVTERNSSINCNNSSSNSSSGSSKKCHSNRNRIVTESFTVCSL